ncbi:MAG: T9SS type A sorting domain-containing protein [Ignavibacteria bacterium]|nr:T9SS type A sorting domain-containing protein [Ignavibacteria bacterium]
MSITNFFESQSEQLKEHRAAHDNFRVFKAEIEDIYDVFNYGMEDPSAVRFFLKNVYETWKIPKLKYVCLLGRASLDPKQNSSSSVYYHNFVPTYGNPPTDGYFVNFNIGTFTYYHQVSVGRIPVYTVTEAQDAVNKIITYDQQLPDKWVKKYIAITGGNPQEQPGFQQKSNILVNNYIVPPPASMVVSKIYRTDSSGYVTYNYKDSIKREIDRGAQIINFIGHAASQDWEIGLENPNTLNNGNKQPLVLSFTCFTGKNSEPNFRSFGESWFLLPNKCAIAFVGSTGWSYSGTGDSYNLSMIKNFSKDSVRRIGHLITYASQVLGTDSNSFPSRNTINCYNLIGDPASSLIMSDTPEFDIKDNDYTLSNPFPALGEVVKLSVFPKNLGTYVDTVRIRFQIRRNGIQTDRSDTIIRTFGYIDTVNHFFSIDSIGNYTMSIIVDPNKNYPQKYYNNDSITFHLTLRNLSYVQIKPLDNAAISSGSFKFTGLNPNVDPQTNAIRLILQVDTSRSFNSSALQTYSTTTVSGITTAFNVNLPSPSLNELYFMRTNAVLNNDSSGWSDVSRVIYNPSISDNPEKLSDSAYSIYSLKPLQYNGSDLTNVEYTANGFELNYFNGDLFVKSFGSNGNEASYILVNNLSYYSDGGSNTGYNIAKVRRFNGQIGEIKNFRMNSPQSSDSVLNFLNTFDSTHFIMAYYASFVPGMVGFSQSVKDKLNQFGSIYADSLRVEFFEDNFDTWAFIGYLGADSTQTCEQFHRYLSSGKRLPLECKMNPPFQNTTGRVTQTIGPADKWKSFSWAQTLFPNSTIKFDVYGLDETNNPNLLYSDLTNNSFINIDTVNFYAYPGLRFDAKIEIDSNTGFQSPVFQSSTVKYVPPAELIPDNNSFTGTDTLVQEGDTVRFSINYYNVGYIDAPAQVNTWYASINGNTRIFAQDTVIAPLRIDSMRTSSVSFSTAGLRNIKVETDTINLYFETALAGDRNEIFSFNNSAITRFIILGDTVQPVMDITYDGQKIQNGDYVPTNPEIVLQFFDNSRMVISDTNNVKVYNFQNNSYKYVPYYISGVKNPEIDITFPDNNFLQATVTYKPTLDPGEHKFRYVATDLTGNYADSVLNTVLVDNTLKINGIANYPNPMQTQTNFMFQLQGGKNPTSCIVKIYTVAGRLVKEINAPANIGYNSIGWDGKDNDGDYIANGVYLYKFVIQGDSQTETSTQKLAVLR